MEPHDQDLARGPALVDPKAEFTVDLDKLTVSGGGVSVPCAIAEGPRKQFLQGEWDATFELIAGKDAVEATVAKTPYFSW